MKTNLLRASYIAVVFGIFLTGCNKGPVKQPSAQSERSQQRPHQDVKASTRPDPDETKQSPSAGLSLKSTLENASVVRLEISPLTATAYPGTLKHIVLPEANYLGNLTATGVFSLDETVHYGAYFQEGIQVTQIDGSSDPTQWPWEGDYIETMVISADGTRLAIFDESSDITVLSTKDGSVVTKFHHPDDKYTSSIGKYLQLSKDGSIVISSGDGNEFHIARHVDSEEEIWKYPKAEDCYSPIAIAEEKDLVVLAGVNQIAALTVTTGAELFSIHFPKEFCVHNLEFAEKDQLLFVAYSPAGDGSKDERIAIVAIELDSLKQRWHAITSLTHLHSLTVIEKYKAVCMNGSKVFFKDNTQEFWDIGSGNLLGVADSESFDAEIVASPTGRYLTADGYLIETPNIRANQ